MAIIYDDLASVMRRLMELGVPLEAIQRAIDAGRIARITCTPNDPPFIPGTEGWRFTVRTLRDELCPIGWRKADPNNFSIVINDARSINIVVESGDALTRRSHGSPRTKALKGLFLEAATVINNAKDDLFPETLEEDVRRAAGILAYPTWILLIYITDDECRAELSLPIAMEGEQITDWAERIFIPDPEDPFADKKTDDDEGTNIDVPVRRK